MKIGNRELGLTAPPYLVAEIGVAHGGSLDRAIAMVRLAATGGADAVKFQAYKADKLAHPDSPTYFQQNGKPAKTQREFFARYDKFGPREYEILAAEAKSVGVDFLCTPFDIQAVEWLNPLVPAWKIASADITNVPLLRAVINTQKPIILSTGAATLREIQRATAIVWSYGAMRDLALLHCVLSYPTPREQANLLAISELQRHFDWVTVGYSDHTLATPDMETCVFAYCLGARIIEKHFTDNKSEPGNDHYHSMDVHDLRKLRMRLNETMKLLGQGDKETIPAVEAPARQYARRGLYAAKSLTAGHRLTPEDIAVLRPAARIGPEDWDGVIGRRLKEPLVEGAPLTWDGLAA